MYEILRRVYVSGEQAEARLQQEVGRVVAYLHSSTEEKLLKDIEEQLLANHQQALLDKEETGEGKL